MSSLSPHQSPPSDLYSRKLPTIIKESPWFRIHKTQHSGLYFGKSKSYRFDDPQQQYGVMYAAVAPHGAFIETFGNQTGIRIISMSELAIRSISELICQQSLKLVDITGEGLAQIGADARLANGDHQLAPRWARQFWSHPENVDGIYYRARHDASQFCAAIFDREKSVFKIAKTQRCDSRKFSYVLADILAKYNFGLVD